MNKEKNSKNHSLQQRYAYTQSKGFNKDPAGKRKLKTRKCSDTLIR